MALHNPRMVGYGRAMTAEEEVNVWNLHVKHKLSAKVIAKRMGLGLGKVTMFLKKRREECGVEVKIDRFRIERPLS